MNAHHSPCILPSDSCDITVTSQISLIFCDGTLIKVNDVIASVCQDVISDVTEIVWFRFMVLPWKHKLAIIQIIVIHLIVMALFLVLKDALHKIRNRNSTN